jgi:large subunit ribosomal protein L21
MKYAIVESGGKQFRAVEGGTLEVDRLPVETGTNIMLEQVLLLADGENITVGTPVVKNTPVWTTVIEHFKGPKVNIFNYSPKKRIRVKIGHRQNYTRLRVEQIGGSEVVSKEPIQVEKAVESEAEELAPKVKARKSIKTEPKSKTSASKSKAPAAKTPAKAATKPSSRKTNAAKVEKKAAPKRKAAVKKPVTKK